MSEAVQKELLKIVKQAKKSQQADLLAATLHITQAIDNQQPIYVEVNMVAAEQSMLENLCLMIEKGCRLGSAATGKKQNGFLLDSSLTHWDMAYTFEAGQPVNITTKTH